MTTASTDGADYWAEQFSAAEAYLTWVTGLDPAGPDAASDGQQSLDTAKASPDSAWAVYYLYGAYGQPAQLANWRFAPEAIDQLSGPTNAALTAIRRIEPSPALDAALRQWQQSAGVEVMALPGEAPRFAH